VESGHASEGSTSARSEDISDSDVVDEFGVEGNFLVGGAEDVREDELRICVLEASFLALGVEEKLYICEQ
jgi:hypothetical protein